jgi:hypothetical protein
MIALWIYLGISLVWAVFAVYKNMTSYSIKPSFWLNAVTFLLNFIIFPVTFVIAIKKKKMFHKHKWVYHDYVPYVDENTQHGAARRKCETCNKKQTNW